MPHILQEIKPNLSPETLQSLASECQEKPTAIYQVLGSMVPAIALAILKHPEANCLLKELGKARAHTPYDWQTENLDFAEMPALIWGKNLQAVSHSFAAFAAVKPSTVLLLMQKVCGFWAVFLQEKGTDKSEFVSESTQFLEIYVADFQALVPASVAHYLGLMPSGRSDYLFTPPFNKNAWIWVLLLLVGLYLFLWGYKYGRP